MQAKLYTAEGKQKGAIDLPASVFGVEINKALLHQVLVLFQANQRQGTAMTKDRSNVSGGGKKPWKQKGTGHARSGSNTSPVWVRGGKAHGPDPRNYHTNIPRKMRAAALASALSSRAQEEKILVIDNLELSAPKTKSIVNLLNALSVDGKRSLLVIDAKQKNVFLSGRNVRALSIKPLADINALDVALNENIIFGRENLISKLEEAVAS
jgi:large subunit ribosomal protein L4